LISVIEFGIAIHLRVTHCNGPTQQQYIGVPKR